MALLKSIAKITGFDLTAADAESAQALYTAPDGYAFQHWSTSSTVDTVATFPIAMTEDKTFYPSIAIQPIVVYTGSDSGDMWSIQNSYADGRLELHDGSSGGAYSGGLEDYYLLSLDASDSNKTYIIGFEGYGTQFGGDFGIINLGDIPTNTTVSYSSDDGTSTKYLKIFRYDYSIYTRYEFVLYNSNKVALSLNDKLPTGNTPAMAYRKVSIQ